MQETSKSIKRRYYHGNFLSKYFVGHGIDVGSGSDPLDQYIGIFPLMASVRSWDINDGDAQYLNTVANNTYDFLHSSHSLEHMKDPYIAIENWIRVVKSNGFLVITIPDEDLYEHGHWPSKFTNEHFWRFTIYKKTSLLTKSINVLDFIKNISDKVVCEKIELINDFFMM